MIAHEANTMYFLQINNLLFNLSSKQFKQLWYLRGNSIAMCNSKFIETLLLESKVADDFEDQ